MRDSGRRSPLNRARPAGVFASPPRQSALLSWRPASSPPFVELMTSAAEVSPNSPPSGSKAEARRQPAKLPPTTLQSRPWAPLAQMLRRSALYVALFGLGTAVALSRPPTGSITVGSVASGAQYTTLTEALADTSSNVIFVYSGTYGGQHFIK